mgnify:CR=1 FL=1
MQNNGDDNVRGGMALVAYLVLVVMAVVAALLVWGVVAVLR